MDDDEEEKVDGKGERRGVLEKGAHVAKAMLYVSAVHSNNTLEGKVQRTVGSENVAKDICQMVVGVEGKTCWPPLAPLYLWSSRTVAVKPFRTRSTEWLKEKEIECEEGGRKWVVGAIYGAKKTD